MLLYLSLASIIITILISLAGAYFMSVWFGGGAQFFIEYIRLFKLDSKIPHIRTFLILKEQGMPDSYLEYIQSNYDNFPVRLVTCEKCLSLWVSSGLLFLFIFLLLFSNSESALTLFSLSHIIAFASSFLTNKIYQLTK